MHPDITIFISSLNKAGISAGLSVSPQTKRAIRCNYRNNTDGSIRWAWPESSRRADFLKFYHNTGFKPGLFCFITRLLAFAGILKMISHGSFFIYVNDKSFVLLKRKWQSRWTWFSGTLGPNRKSILWYRDDSNASCFFVKIPLTQRAKDNLNTEAAQLRFLQSLQYKSMLIPGVADFGTGCLQLNDIGQKTTRTNQFVKLPFAAIKEWLQTGITNAYYIDSAFARKLGNKLDQLQEITDERIPQTLLNRLEQLQKESRHTETLATTTAHGDFTPWNLMVKDQKLHCIDWELSCGQMPVFFDLFHYVYQSNILIGNKGYKAIRHELDDLFALPQWIEFVAENSIDTTEMERLYLLYTTAYYLLAYHLQPEWHLQVNWLLTTWNEALGWHLNNSCQVMARKLLLKETGLLLAHKRCAVLKWTHGDIETLPEGSDIDICINRKDAKAMCYELGNHTLVANIHTRKKSFMTQVEIVLTDGGMVHIDMISKFKRRSTVFLDAESLLANAGKNKYGLKIPAIEDDFAYTWLFNWLNHSDVQEKQKLSFSNIDMKDKVKVCIMLREKYRLPIKSYKDVLLQDKSLYQTLLDTLSSWDENKGFCGLWNKFQYVIDSARNLFPEKGLIITFSGVDGAGKSTVIENVRQLIDKRLRKKVIVLRHRPGLLPILSAIKHGKKQAESKAAHTLPRQGKNNSKLSSLFRFGYYYLDYLLGQWYVQLWYVQRGYVVLYDRYYFDFISDTKRSNINLSSSLTAWWYRFLLKPRLNFFLYANEDLILQRKQELDAVTIRVLTNKYLSLFNVLKRDSHKALYISLENKDLSETLGFIFSNIKNAYQ